MSAGILTRFAGRLRAPSERPTVTVRVGARAPASSSWHIVPHLPLFPLPASRLLPSRLSLVPVPAAPLWISAVMATKGSGKPDLSSDSGNWKEAKSFLKGLNSKQRREHYGTKDYVKLKEIHTWKETAKSVKLKKPEEVKYQKDKDLNEKISVFRGDITKLEVDAIVNAG